MCRVLAERKLVVGGWTVIVWKACKRPSQYRIHGNEAKTEREGEKKAEREQERKKKSYEALTDDLTGETEFVFCREMSDALPVREREMERERHRERETKNTPQNVSCVFFTLFFLLRFKTARWMQQHQRPSTQNVHCCSSNHMKQTEREMEKGSERWSKFFFLFLPLYINRKLWRESV